MASVIVSYRVTVVTATPVDELFELETVVAHAVDEEHDVCAVVISIVFTSELVVFFGVNVFAVDLAPVAVVQGVSFDGRECVHGKSGGFGEKCGERSKYDGRMARCKIEFNGMMMMR